MSAKMVITDSFYKANNLSSCLPPYPVKSFDCAKGEKVYAQAVVLSDTAAYLCTDTTPSLGIKPFSVYRLQVDSELSVRVCPITYMEDNNGVKYADIVQEESICFYTGDLPICAMLEIQSTIDLSKTFNIKVSLFVKYGLNDEQLVTTSCFDVTVHDVLLTRPQQYSLYVDLWQHNCNIARTYGVQTWSDQHFSHIEKVLDMLCQLGQKSATVVVSDAPWRGWGCNLMRDYPANLFEYNIVSVIKIKEGGFVYDYTALDRYIKLCQDKGMCKDISLYGLLGIWKMPYFSAQVPEYPEAVMIRYKDYDGKYCYMKKQSEIMEYVSSLFAHLKDLGVWEKVRIAADEPSDLTAFDQNLAILKMIASDVKLKMAIDKEEVISSHGQMLADIAYSYPCAQNAKKETSARRLWYVCNVPQKPNSLLANSLLDTYILALLNYKMNFDGFLRWAFTCWTENPLKDIRYNINGLPAGDMCLVYPSKNGNVLPSLRYIALKQGIAFYEMVMRLKKVDTVLADEIMSMMIVPSNKRGFTKAGETLYYSNNPQHYRNAFRELLLALKSKGV